MSPLKSTLYVTVATLAMGLTACNATPSRSANEADPAMQGSANAAAADEMPANGLTMTDGAAHAAAPDTKRFDGNDHRSDHHAVETNVHSVRFPSGATSVTLSGTVHGQTDQIYTIYAKDGQHMHVALNGPSSTYFTVFAPGKKPSGDAMFRGANGGDTFDTVLDGTGTYMVQVDLYRDAARRDAKEDYRLAITIDDANNASHEHASHQHASAPADTGASSPQDVVRHYYAAIDAKRYRDAYRLWADNAQNHQSYTQFAHGFDHTASTSVHVTGPMHVEGAAGSAYATVPVRVESTLDNGQHQHFTGKYVLRRANHVSGASAADRSWHLYSAKLNRG